MDIEVFFEYASELTDGWENEIDLDSDEMYSDRDLNSDSDIDLESDENNPEYLYAEDSQERSLELEDGWENEIDSPELTDGWENERESEIDSDSDHNVSLGADIYSESEVHFAIYELESIDTQDGEILPRPIETITSSKKNATPLTPVTLAIPQPVTWTCGICWENPLLNQPFSLVCGHVFCKLCIETALQFSRMCPKCRRYIKRSDMHPLYN